MKAGKHGAKNVGDKFSQPFRKCFSRRNCRTVHCPSRGSLCP